MTGKSVKFTSIELETGVPAGDGFAAADGSAAEGPAADAEGPTVGTGFVSKKSTARKPMAAETKTSVPASASRCREDMGFTSKEDGMNGTVTQNIYAAVMPERHRPVRFFGWMDHQMIAFRK